MTTMTQASTNKPKPAELPEEMDGYFFGPETRFGQTHAEPSQSTFPDAMLSDELSDALRKAEGEAPEVSSGRAYAILAIAVGICLAITSLIGCIALARWLVRL